MELGRVEILGQSMEPRRGIVRVRLDGLEQGLGRASTRGEDERALDVRRVVSPRYLSHGSHRIRYELREVKPDEFQYQVQLPLDAKTDSLSAEIIALDPSEGTEVEWKPEKTKGA